LDTLAAHALETAKLKGAQYADVRVVHAQNEDISVKNGVVENLMTNESLGFGVRVLVDGAWGFAASRDMTPAEVDRVAALAVKIARASALVRGEAAQLGPPVTSQGTYMTPVEIDAFRISTEAKLDLLLQADAAMARVQGITVRNGHLSFVKEHKTFANSEGADTGQTIYEAGGGIIATAVSGNEVQRRSYPSIEAQGSAGWEYVLAMDLPGNAERIATEAVQLLTAEQCPSDSTSVILGSEQLALQIHESCGHPIELDRVFGTEAAMAGTSFLTTENERLPYGSDVVKSPPNPSGQQGWAPLAGMMKEFRRVPHRSSEKGCSPAT
jgi:TldD protein